MNFFVNNSIIKFMIEIETLSTKLGQRIKIVRMKAGITQNDLANTSNISVAALSKIERGEVYPTIDTVAKIANALNLNFEKIFDFQF